MIGRGIRRGTERKNTPRKWKKSLGRIAAGLLVVMLTGNTFGWPVVTVMADEELQALDGGTTGTLGGGTDTSSGGTDTSSGGTDTSSGGAGSSQAGEPEAETPGTEEEQNGEETPEEDSAVNEIQALIDALPAANAITADNAALVLDNVQTIEKAYSGLSDEQKAALKLTKYEAAQSFLEERTLTETSGVFYDGQGIKYTVTDTGTASVTGCSSNVRNKINIPEFVIKDEVAYSVTKIGASAFRSKSITNVVIPKSVTEIGANAFYNCMKLLSVSVNSDTVSIGNSAFWGCSALMYTSFSGTVTNIGNGAFSGCTSLLDAGISKCSEGMEIGSSAFMTCNSLTSIKIPNGVTSIGMSAFSGCSAATQITIPESVTTIGMWAFTGCSDLTGIVIPAGVTSIGMRAFWNCTGLTSIELQGTNITIQSLAFGGCAGLKSISIPCDFPQEKLNSLGITTNEDVTVVYNHHWINWKNVDTNKITASCAYQTTCQAEDRVITLTAPEGPITYDGNSHTVNVEDNYADASKVSVIYKISGLPAIGLPKTAGTYTASVTMTGEDKSSATASVEFTIEAEKTETIEKTTPVIRYQSKVVESEKLWFESEEELSKAINNGDFTATDGENPVEGAFKYSQSSGTTYKVIFTPNDTDRYTGNMISVEVSQTSESPEEQEQITPNIQYDEARQFESEEELQKAIDSNFFVALDGSETVAGTFTFEQSFATYYTVTFTPEDNERYTSRKVTVVVNGDSIITGGGDDTTDSSQSSGNIWNDIFPYLPVIPGDENNEPDPGTDTPDTPDEPDTPDDSDRVDIPDKTIDRVESDKDGGNGKSGGKQKDQADKKEKDKEKSGEKSGSSVSAGQLIPQIEVVQETISNIVSNILEYETGGVIMGVVQVGAAMVSSGEISLKMIRAVMILAVDIVVALITLFVIVRSRKKEKKK